MVRGRVVRLPRVRGHCVGQGGAESWGCQSQGPSEGDRRWLQTWCAPGLRRWGQGSKAELCSTTVLSGFHSGI